MPTYSKLRGRIVEKFGSQVRFAEAIGISQVSLSRKLNCEVGFSQKEIVKWAELLDIKTKDYGLYFFT